MLTNLRWYFMTEFVLKKRSKTDHKCFRHHLVLFKKMYLGHLEIEIMFPFYMLQHFRQTIWYSRVLPGWLQRLWCDLYLECCIRSVGDIHVGNNACCNDFLCFHLLLFLDVFNNIFFTQIVYVGTRSVLSKEKDDDMVYQVLS